MNDQAQPEPVAGLPVRPGVLTAGILSLLLYLSLVGLPLLGVLVAPMAAVPVLAVRSSGTAPVLAWGWPALVLAAAAWSQGIPWLILFTGYLLLVALPAASVEWWEAAGWSEGRWVGVATGIALVTILGLTLALTSGDPVAATRLWIHKAGADAESLYTSMGMGKGQAGLMLDRAEGVLGWALPGMVGGYLILTLFWLRPRLQMLRLPVGTVPFEEYRNDDWLPAVFALAGGATLLASGTLRWIAVNLLLTVLILFFVQGLAMIRAHVVRFVGRGVLVRWGLGLICLQPPLVFAVVALGMVDSFRSLRPAPVNDDGRKE